MKEKKKQYSELRELLIRSLEEGLSKDQNLYLCQLLKDPDLAEYYLDFLNMSIGFREINWSVNKTISATGADQVLSRDLWCQLAYEEKTAETVEIEKPKAPVAVQSVRVQKASREISKYAFFTTLASVAALLLIVVYVQMLPQPSEQAATVSDTVGAVWENTTDEIDRGTPLFTRQPPLSLAKGIVKIDFIYGAQVVIEGPAEFELLSGNQMNLKTGRVYAKVSERASGFIVDTPTSRVVDMGTEFGIKVDQKGASDVHMIKGQASLIVGAKGQRKETHNLIAGQAKRIHFNGQSKDILIDRVFFAREVSSETGFIWRGQKTMDLSDVVGGGNGFGTGITGLGINLQTGESVALKHEQLDQVKTGYQSVLSNLFIDGVFVPNSHESEGTQITSQKHVYQDYPRISGTYNASIFNNRTIKTTYGTISLSLAKEGTKPLICIHSNAGITFDLNAIRRYYQIFEIQSFTVSSGIALEARSEDTDNIDADIHVLIDGEPRISPVRIIQGENPFEIDIVIRPEDRFLTLVATEGIANHGDWVIFESPTLHIEAKD